MSELYVGKVGEFEENDRRIVHQGELEIGVMKRGGEFRAYSNYCLHQGGPACEGIYMAKIEDALRPDKTSLGLRFSETEVHFVCPWHGFEYDFETGECAYNKKLKLRKFDVITKGEEVYVIV
jgi:nitrite reductase/ring-hydroxylating ferredoxin subunit